MEQIISGAATPARTAGFLAALRAKDETPGHRSARQRDRGCRRSGRTSRDTAGPDAASGRPDSGGGGNHLPVRAEVTARTVDQPVRPPSQVVGVADARMAPVVAGVLAARGRSALVVRGDDGLDKLTTSAPSQVWTVRRHRDGHPARCPGPRSPPGTDRRAARW
ncbi:hypothetical protein ACFY36_12655 [Actinoplanes sp. NPDC000266]